MPTEEEIKELWEWCGFKPRYVENSTQIGRWIKPDGGWRFFLPDIDLNNLFKYAVPKLIGDYKYTLELETDVDYHSRENTYIVTFSNDPLIINSQVTDKDPALALFWAIYKIIHKEED